MKKLYMILCAAFVAASFSAQAENAWGLQGAGTEADPYQISTAADIQALATNISATNKGTGEYFKMMNDIDMNGAAYPNIGKGGIENILTINYGFNGTFDGNGKTIKGINHNVTTNVLDGKWNGVFASVDTLGVVKNLVIGADNTLSGYTYTSGVAAICKGTITNCVNNANISSANAYAAGICGFLVNLLGTVDNCTNNGDITAKTYACGIVGGTQNISGSDFNYVVTNNTNNGNMSTINGVGSSGIIGVFAGGTLVGNTNNGTIDDSKGTASSKLYTAGIVSCLYTHKKCEGNVNKGSVSGNKHVGGVVAYVMKSTLTSIAISNNTNEGAVTGTQNVGGIVGNTIMAQDVVTISNCTNSGVVTCSDETTVGNLRGSSLIALGEGNVIAKGLQHLALDPEATGITNVTVTRPATGVAYNLAGQRVAPTAQGVVIIDGKKYINK